MKGTKQPAALLDFRPYALPYVHLFSPISWVQFTVQMSIKYIPAGTAHENTLVVNRVVSESIAVRCKQMCHIPTNLKIHKSTQNTLSVTVLRRCFTLKNHLINECKTLLHLRLRSDNRRI